MINMRNVKVALNKKSTRDITIGLRCDDGCRLYDRHVRPNITKDLRLCPKFEDCVVSTLIKLGVNSPLKNIVFLPVG